MQLTFASLYSGAGGLDLGFAQAGFVPAFANEIDLAAVATHQRLIGPYVQGAGHIMVAGDLTKVRWPGRGEADIVIGGPPCQGFSVAGRMDPLDPRSLHVVHYLEFVDAVRPTAFVMENVAALSENARWADLRGHFLQRARSMGYEVTINVANSRDYGVAQSRRRAFFVGTRAGANPSNPLAALTRRRRTAGAVLRRLPPHGSPGNDSLVDARITFARKPVLRRSAYAGMMFNGSGRPINLAGQAGTLTASMGGNRTPIVDEQALRAGMEPWIVAYHRHLANGGAPYKGEPPHRLRRLSVQEAAALQGFPNEVEWVGSRVSQLRQIGNAVPPPLARAVAIALKGSLQSRADTDLPVGDSSDSSSAELLALVGV